MQYGLGIDPSNTALRAKRLAAAVILAAGSLFAHNALAQFQSSGPVDGLDCTPQAIVASAPAIKAKAVTPQTVKKSHAHHAGKSANLVKKRIGTHPRVRGFKTKKGRRIEKPAAPTAVAATQANQGNGHVSWVCSVPDATAKDSKPTNTPTNLLSPSPYPSSPAMDVPDILTQKPPHFMPPGITPTVLHPPTPVDDFKVQTCDTLRKAAFMPLRGDGELTEVEARRQSPYYFAYCQPDAPPPSTITPPTGYTPPSTITPPTGHTPPSTITPHDKLLTPPDNAATPPVAIPLPSTAFLFLAGAGSLFLKGKPSTPRPSSQWHKIVIAVLKGALGMSANSGKNGPGFSA